MIRGAGSSGIYLETGSKWSTVTENLIVDNGFGERSGRPGGHLRRHQVVVRGSVKGISVYGYENAITANRFSGNSNGGVFL